MGGTFRLFKEIPEKWDQWAEIKRCNPLTKISASFRKRLLLERNEARGDTRLKARFLSATA